ncbi:hypothetical protein [Prevotella corporis]|uniref:hypothetical protein n=2 Tax=Prevotella corporis TaxID=28128 RepID=UPI0023660908|nr:hypothetical protein [Prevotella corporis]
MTYSKKTPIYRRFTDQHLPMFAASANFAPVKQWIKLIETGAKGSQKGKKIMITVLLVIAVVAATVAQAINVNRNLTA